MPPDVDQRPERVPLEYASANLPRPERTTRLILGLLFAFIALGAIFFALVIYMSWIG